MTQYTCFRICQRGTDCLGTVTAESINDAESLAYRRWAFDEDGGEYLDVQEESEGEA